jgi:hypothetical protein
MVNRTEFEEINNGDYLAEGYYNGILDYLNNLKEESFIKSPAVAKNDVIIGSPTISEWINQTTFIKVDVSGSNWDIKLTTNLGSTFTTIKTTSFEPTVEAHKTDRNCISIYDGINIEFFSDDMGSTWNTITAQANPSYPWGAKAKMGSGGRLYSIGFENSTYDVAISYSDNYGSSWTVAYTSTLLIDNPNNINLEVGDNNTFAYGFFDSSGKKAETGYSLDSGNTIVKRIVDDTQEGYYGDIPKFIFINSDNYIISTRTSRRVNDDDYFGNYIIKWNGNIISSSPSYSWNSSTKVSNNVLVFSLNYFIYTTYDLENEAKRHRRLISYSKNYEGLIIMPILSYPNTNLKFLGIGTDDEELFADDTYLYKII